MKRQNRPESLALFRPTLRKSPHGWSLAIPLAIIGGMALGACTNSAALLEQSPTTATGKTLPTTMAGYCHSRDLKVSFVSTSAATGLVGGRFNVINTSNQPCSIEGYPSILAFGSRGSAVYLDVKDGGVSPLGSAYDGKPKLLLLLPKRYALILAEWSDVGTYSGSCPNIAKLFFRLPGIGSNLPVNVASAKSGDSTFSPCLGKVFVSPIEFLGPYK
ncbi:MAG: DUF4232 domain-containing protein [Acidimicrobiaceae bacterium]|nr:DUF4232 domain-containing protein [Acidimicrobiaceae bacterium]